MLNEKGKTNHTVSYTQVGSYFVCDKNDWFSQHFVSEEFELEQMNISRSPAGRPATKKKKKKKKKRMDKDNNSN